MWDILKDKKYQYVFLIKDVTYINEAADELSLHHDYSINAATQNSRQVQQLTDYIKTIVNPDILICLVTRLSTLLLRKKFRHLIRNMC